MTRVNGLALSVVVTHSFYKVYGVVIGAFTPSRVSRAHRAIVLTRLTVFQQS